MSFRTRMLVAMLVVALVASVLTAVLVRRQTVDAVREAAQGDIDQQLLIADEILRHGFETSGWNGLEPLVRELATDFDTRIAVLALDEQVLADSDPGASLPEEPRRFIDPEFDLIESLAESFIDDAFAGEDESLEPLEDDAFTLESFGIDPAELPEPVLLYIGYGADDLIDLGSLDLDALLLAIVGIVVLAALLSFVIAGRVGGPLRRLSAAAQGLGAGDLSQRVPERGGPELAGLASSFNSMAENLERSEAARSHMVSDVAHELRNPVGVLQGNLEAAQDGVFTIDRALIDTLHDETMHLSQLVGDLQQLALADAGALEIRPSRVDLGELAGRVVAAQRGAAAEADVALAVDASPAEADVDPTRMYQVLSNLVTNAIAYTSPGGHVTVTVAAESDGTVISVADTGIGMTPDEAGRAFDRFWRADPSRTRSTGGSGVGLSICKELVEVHGGTIGVESEAGRGSTFTIALPRT